MQDFLQQHGLTRVAGVLCLALLASCGQPTTRTPAQLIQLGLHVDSRTGATMVRKGDTVGHIAERYRLNIRDIIDYNTLSPPYHLSENQRLLLPAPAQHKVGAQDTLPRLARMYGVSPSELVQLNRLSPPYRLQVGQMVRLPPAVARQGGGAVPSSPQRAAVPAKEALPAVSARPLTQAATATAAPKAHVSSQAARPFVAQSSAAAPIFSWPVRGQIISAYGPKQDGLYNDGINIAAARGSQVKAAEAGTVVYVGSELRSYGTMVLIRHAQGYVTAYAHMEKASVIRGASVGKGQVIGSVGSSGTVAQPQLHFEVRKGSQTFDPQRYIKG